MKYLVLTELFCIFHVFYKDNVLPSWLGEKVHYLKKKLVTRGNKFNIIVRKIEKNTKLSKYMMVSISPPKNIYIYTEKNIKMLRSFFGYQNKACFTYFFSLCFLCIFYKWAYFLFWLEKNTYWKVWPSLKTASVWYFNILHALINIIAVYIRYHTTTPIPQVLKIPTSKMNV